MLVMMMVMMLVMMMMMIMVLIMWMMMDGINDVVEVDDNDDDFYASINVKPERGAAWDDVGTLISFLRPREGF